MNEKNDKHSATRLDAGVIAQVAALISAITASACCWLPLLLIALGVSGGAVAATFEAWRPVLLPVTLGLLGIAFYFSYRKPKVSTTGEGEDCCLVPVAEDDQESCCPPENTKGLSIKKLNKVMLWVMTVFVLAFAFFPSYVGYIIGGSDTVAVSSDLDKIVVVVDGMTCEACSVSIQDSLRKVPGVEAAEVNYNKKQAVIGVAKGSELEQNGILSAIRNAVSDAGYTAKSVEKK
jgi:copper chaperone CopZ